MRYNRRQVTFGVHDVRFLKFGRMGSKIRTFYAKTPANEKPSGHRCRILYIFLRLALARSRVEILCNDVPFAGCMNS